MTLRSISSNNGQGHPIGPIGIIGGGVVGGACRAYFEQQGFSVIVYDKFKPMATLDQLEEAETIFVCVPTPYVENRGLDTQAIEESISLLRSPKTVIIKSTVVPGSTDRLAQAFPMHRVMFNPEFLREKTANEDFLHPDRQLVGYTRPEDAELAQSILQILPRAPFESVLPARACEMIKVATNGFLALKVTYANEIYDLCSALSVDYESVKQGLYADARVGASHFDIFEGGYRGFGGKCLPKDSLALMELAESTGLELELLAAAQHVNERLLEDTEALADAA